MRASTQLSRNLFVKLPRNVRRLVLPHILDVYSMTFTENTNNYEVGGLTATIIFRVNRARACREGTVKSGSLTIHY